MHQTDFLSPPSLSPDDGGSVTLLPGERLETVNEDLRLIERTDGLTFGTDAYLLSAFIRRSPHTVAVELGGGSGIISLLLAKRNKVKAVYAAEIQPAFAALIGRNAALNGLDKRVLPVRADVRDLRPSDFGGEVGLVFSNPPYMKCGAGKRNRADEKYIARHEVCGDIGDFCGAAARLLRHGGRFVCVYRPDRLSELFAALRAVRLEPKRATFVHADSRSSPSSVLIEAVKGAAPSLSVTPPLLLWENTDGSAKRRMTPEAEAVYRDGAFPFPEQGSGKTSKNEK